MSSPLPRSRPASPFVTARFADAQRAQRAFELLVEASFDPKEISLLRIDDERRAAERVPVEHKTGVPIGVTTGVALGGTLGVASVVLGGPLGLLAAGPILGALQGALAGAMGGGLLGALAGLAFWWDEPGLEGELRKGSVLVGVSAQGARADAARRALLAAGATRIFG